LNEECPPIIAMTAFSDDSDITNFIQQGFNDYQPKPIKANEFIDKVIKWTLPGVNQRSQLMTNELPESQPEVLNMKTLHQLEKYIAFDNVITTIQEFNCETIEQLKACEELLSKYEYEKIGGYIHTIKGNSGTLGGDRIHLLSAKMEKNIKEGQFSSLHEDLKSLYLVFIEFKKEVSNQLNIVFDG